MNTFKERIKTIILEVLKGNAENLGNLYVYKEDLLLQINQYLQKYSLFDNNNISLDLIEHELNSLITSLRWCFWVWALWLWCAHLCSVAN